MLFISLYFYYLLILSSIFYPSIIGLHTSSHKVFNFPISLLKQIRKSNQKSIEYSTFSTLSMVSVSGVPSSPNSQPQPPKSKAFIISPSINSAEAEMLILQNFNQIQQGDRSKVGIIGSNNLSEDHKQMVELLTYALVLSGNHIYTSGGGNGTNIAVVKGALRACNPDLLTVILPQSLYKQPAEIQPLLSRIANLIQQPEFDELELKEAAALCNEQIINIVDKILVFAYHDSTTILNSVAAVNRIKGNTIFYLD